MGPAPLNDRESELSYAYLHAVVSAVGGSCDVAPRIDDNNGIDAKVSIWPENQSGLTEIDLKVQLKATRKPPTIKNKKNIVFFQGGEAI